ANSLYRPHPFGRLRNSSRLTDGHKRSKSQEKNKKLQHNFLNEMHLPLQHSIFLVPCSIFSEAHHLLKLHRLSPAHFYFFSTFQFKQKATVEVRFDLIDHAEVDNMLAV